MADKRVRVSETVVEKFVCQTVNKLVNGFEVKSVRRYIEPVTWLALKNVGKILTHSLPAI